MGFDAVRLLRQVVRWDSRRLDSRDVINRCASISIDMFVISIDIDLMHKMWRDVSRS